MGPGVTPSSTYTTIDHPVQDERNASTSESDNEPSEYQDTPPHNISPNTPEQTRSPTGTSTLSEISLTPSTEDMRQRTRSRREPTLQLNDIGELLQSHEEDIVNRVVTQINSQNLNRPRQTQANT
ncbi:hypothetical protein B9Z19DRAFT_1126146 [Tuber borchii]|uniref:Uncharacterized protein n=1 Tax=Tuber borchii TaxID=42251 RepID=A0A2T6ZTG1_TUBBO|nr:hypothetical protein B9Z19DRAFT_1126146 [Tuber borchii]